MSNETSETISLSQRSNSKRNILDVVAFGMLSGAVLALHMHFNSMEERIRALEERTYHKKSHTTRLEGSNDRDEAEFVGDDGSEAALEEDEIAPPYEDLEKLPTSKGIATKNCEHVGDTDDTLEEITTTSESDPSPSQVFPMDAPSKKTSPTEMEECDKRIEEDEEEEPPPQRMLTRRRPQ